MNDTLCRWCGEGTYQAVVKATTETFIGGRGRHSVERLGLRAVSTASWLVLRCAGCGHTEWFLVRQ